MESGVQEVGPVRSRRDPNGVADGDRRLLKEDEEKDREDSDFEQIHV